MDGATQTTVARMAEIRLVMAELSAKKWAELLERAAEEKLPEGVVPTRETQHTYRGEIVVLSGVDPSRQVGSGGDRLLIHRDERQRWWAIEAEPVRALLASLRAAKSELGWSEEPAWDVVARLDRVDWTSAAFDETRDDCCFLTVVGILAPGQVAVFKDPARGAVVPGLASARAELERIRSAVDDAELALHLPQGLLPILVRALALRDRALFDRLWVADASDMSLAYAFQQFIRAFEASDGRITFDRYDPRQRPEDHPGCGDVKLFVRREGIDGTVTTRPLSFSHDGARWRIRSGTI